MRLKLIYVKQLVLSSLIAISANHLYAQNTDYYSLLITGNTAEVCQDNELINIWEKESKSTENIAFLLLGNINDSGGEQYSYNYFQKGDHPLLLAPGEKEWANGSSLGKEMIKNIEEELLEEYGGRVYFPDAACPGPKEVILNDHLVVILLDTQWWVHKHDRRFSKCDIETTGDVLVQIEDAIRRHYTTKHVVIAGHHSLKSFGNSDGYFTLKQNVFGAPYTLYRKVLGSRKDNHHPDFKGFRDVLLSVFREYPDIVYVSAGDANLQYFTLDNVHHLISGSFENTEFFRSDLAEFGSSEKGFARLNFSSEGECELIFTGLQGEMFRKNLYRKDFADTYSQEKVAISLTDSILVKASSKYNMKESAYFWMGENYRSIWDTPVKVPVFDIDNKIGGLQVIKRGGGQQTLSLRLEDKYGRQYVLRSIEKNVEPTMPEEFKNTFPVDIVQDQISASNPYAALVVAKLAEDAGIFHTNPEIVYVPDDPRFGVYRQDVADQLFLFEERPANNRSDVASFGNSEEIISTDKMISNIFGDENHFVDTDAILRARLFDILINDWDRHDDQWRWASFKNGEETIYKPIPRDRDQAFFLNEGVIPWIAGREFLIPIIQGFDEFTENMDGHTFNARFFDRTFLIQSDWNDWLGQIDSLKLLLTYEEIDIAVLSFPKEVQQYCATQTATILKSRYENLEPMARKLYLSLSKEVSITGTNKKDLFEIHMSGDSIIRVTAYHINKENEKGAEIYSRTFYSTETKKILIYGFDKKDHFIIKGRAESKIKLYIIGGNDQDEVIYESEKAPRSISIYDKNRSNFSQILKPSVKNIYDENLLEYDRESFKYDVVSPGLYVGYNQDDGVFLGGGPVFNKYSRYRNQRYEVFANYAFSTNAYNFHFAGKNVFPLKHLEWNLIANIKSPYYVMNYFGMGNETIWQSDIDKIDYYRVTMREYFVKPEFTKYLNNDEEHKVSLGLFYKYTDIDASPDRYISDFTSNGLETDDLLPKSFLGASINYKLNTISKLEIKKENEFGGSSMFHTRGIQLETEIAHFVGLNEDTPDFTKISGEWTSYISFSSRPRVVYAIRVGGEKVFGNYVFNEAAKLGQRANLRGFRQTRFYGDANFYLNTEIRIRSKQLSSYIFNIPVGLFLFNDLGRVWIDGESSSRWHDGYGIGFWWAPYDMALLNVSYAGSKEDNLINLSINYQF